MYVPDVLRTSECLPETKSFELLTDTPETLEGQGLLAAEVSGWGMWSWMPGKAKDLP